jgi:hypothetical protein
MFAIADPAPVYERVSMKERANRSGISHGA